MNAGLEAANKRLKEITEAKRGLESGEFDLADIIDHRDLQDIYLSRILTWQKGWANKKALKFIDRYKITDKPLYRLSTEVKDFIKERIHEPLPPKKAKGPYAPSDTLGSQRAREPEQVEGTDQSVRHRQGLAY